MDNIKLETNGDILTITVDLSHDGGNSGSGKSKRIASSMGNVSIPGVEGVKMGLNIYRPLS